MTDADALDAPAPPGRASESRASESHAPSASLQLAYEPDFDVGSAAYRDLFARADATPFQHPLWLAPFARQLAPARGASFGALVGRAAGELRLVAPLILRRRHGVRLMETADLGVGDYAAPVVDRDWTPELVRQAGRLAAEALPLLPPHDLLRIRPVRAEHVPLWRAILDAEAAPLDFSAHATPLPATHAAWRADALSATFRKTLERKAKRFGKLEGAWLRLVADPQEIAATIRLVAALRAGRFEGDMIGEPSVREFYVEAAVAGARSGFARTHVLEAEGRVLAGLFGLVHAGRHHYLLLGCDYARDGRLSPGLVAYDGLIRDFIAEGGESFDFTIGDEPFKRHFGTVATPMFVLERARSLRGRAALALQRLARRRAASRAAAQGEDDDDAA